MIRFCVEFGKTDDGRDIALIVRGDADDEFAIAVDIQSGHAVWLLDGDATDDRPTWSTEAELLAADLGAKSGVTVQFVSSSSMTRWRVESTNRDGDG